MKGLSPGRGTAFLRLLDHRSEVVAKNLCDLFAERELDEVKEAIGAAVMNEPKLFDPREHQLTWEEARSVFLAEGRAEGRAEGQRAEAQALAGRLLRVRLGDPLPPELERALGACSNRACLEQVAELAVRPGPDEVLAAEALALLHPRD